MKRGEKGVSRKGERGGGRKGERQGRTEGRRERGEGTTAGLNEHKRRKPPVNDRHMKS